MPTINVDAEQAALMEVAFAMLEGALVARVARADPDKVISNSLQLQAHKLATVRAHLRAAEPPDFGMLPESVQNAVRGAATGILQATKPADIDAHFRRLRGFVNAASVHPTSPAGHPRVSTLESERDR